MFVAWRTVDVVAREANVSVAKLTEWRDRALAGAASALKERERDGREDEIARLPIKVGEITMDNELLSAKIAAIEAKSPFGPKEVETMSQTVSPLPRLVLMAWRGSRARGAFRAPAFLLSQGAPSPAIARVVATIQQAAAGC